MPRLKRSREEDAERDADERINGERSAQRPRLPPRSLPYYTTRKDALANVVEDPATVGIIEDIVLSVHGLTIMTLDFLKAYLLHCFENPPHVLPKLDQDFVRHVMTVLAEKNNPYKLTNHGRMTDETRLTKAKLSAFYDSHFAAVVPPGTRFESTNLLQVWQYVANDIVKDYENNIKQHFVEYVQRFVNVMCQKAPTMALLEGESAEKQAFVRRLQRVKQQLLDGKMLFVIDDDEDMAAYVHHQLQPHLPFILPRHRPLEKNSVYYDLKVHPQDYLPCMIYMMREVEAADQTLYNVFPMRNHLVPCNVRIDTKSVIQLLLRDTHGLGNKSELLKKVTANAVFVWGAVFKTQKRSFAPRDKRYTFAYQILTDGVSVSIIWRDRARDRPPRHEPTDKPAEVYIDDIPPSLLNNKPMHVGIDPNKGDLIYASAIHDGHHLTFRYTQDQRRKESKRKVYAKRHERLKHNTPVGALTVQQWEAQLSQFNRKTLNLTAFLTYLGNKYRVYNALAAFYQHPRFRQAKWHTFINTQRSEAKMLNHFKEKFGPPGEVVIGFGDWEQRKQMKYKEPTKGVGMRRIFRRAGYSLYLVDEYRTSCQCYSCAVPTARCETFRRVADPRPWKAGVMRTCHGLVKCNTCSKLWNRDVNSSLNILRLMQTRAAGQERPLYLRRGNHQQ